MGTGAGHGGVRMPKWTRRFGAVAVASAGLLGVAAGAQAATPAVSMGAATTAVTLPAGCTANSVKVVNSPDGSYHGYIQATCDKRAKLFYVSRSSAGTWALRSTAIDMPIPYAIAVDNTGTYFVGKRSNHDLVLVRRNGNGSLSTVHVLEKWDGLDFIRIERATVIAANGNYWAAWDDNDYSLDFQDHSVKQASTMSPPISPSDSGLTRAYAPTLVSRGSGSPRLIVCEMSTDWNPDGPVPSTVVATETSGKWRESGQFSDDSCADVPDTNSPGVAAYLNGHLYFSRDFSNGIYDDRSGTVQRTALTGSTRPEAVLGITGTRVAFVAADKAGREQEWLQNSDGTFSAAPTGVLSAAPVPVHQDQIINRSGKLIRLFIQDDGHNHGGRRLLEQIQR